MPYEWKPGDAVPPQDTLRDALAARDAEWRHALQHAAENALGTYPLAEKRWPAGGPAEAGDWRTWLLPQIADWGATPDEVHEVVDVQSPRLYGRTDPRPQ